MFLRVVVSSSSSGYALAMSSKRGPAAGKLVAILVCYKSYRRSMKRCDGVIHLGKQSLSITRAIVLLVVARLAASLLN
jgi:hypothetical protein